MADWKEQLHVVQTSTGRRRWAATSSPDKYFICTRNMMTIEVSAANAARPSFPTAGTALQLYLILTLELLVYFPPRRGHV